MEWTRKVKKKKAGTGLRNKVVQPGYVVKKKTIDKPKDRSALKLLVFIPCIALLGRGFLLTESTFIPAGVMVFVLAGSGLATVLLALLFRLIRKMHLWTLSLIWHFLIGLSLGYSLFVHINYYGPGKGVESLELPILKKGLGNTMRGYRECGEIPFGLVVFDHVEREIDFPCVDKELFTKAGKIALEVKRGALGYYIYSKESLIP